MSSVNKKESIIKKKVTKDLFRRNPTIIDHFSKWYPTYAKEYPTLPNNIDDFFDLNFKWTIWVWWDYFYDCGIDIAVGQGKVYVFYNGKDKSPYPNLSGRNEIFGFDSDVDPTIRFETAVAELICRIDTPF